MANLLQLQAQKVLLLHPLVEVQDQVMTEATHGVNQAILSAEEDLIHSVDLTHSADQETHSVDQEIQFLDQTVEDPPQAIAKITTACVARW